MVLGGGALFMSEVPSIVSAHGELNVYVNRSLQVFWRGNCWRRNDLIGRVFMINTRAQRKLLHTWIILVIVKEHLVQIGRIDEPTE